MSERLQARLAAVETMTTDDHRQNLLRRDNVRTAYRQLAPMADAVITLSCPGPAPLWPGDKPGEPLLPRPTGSAAFNCPSSLAGIPAVTIPMLAINGLPLGVQLMGQDGEEARMTSLARWVHRNIEPVVCS